MGKYRFPRLLSLLSFSILSCFAWEGMEAAPATISLGVVQRKLELPIVQICTNDNLVLITDKTNSVNFFPGYRRAEVNKLAIWLNEPTLPDAVGTALVARIDLDRQLLPALKPWPGISVSNRMVRVMLDPGHGGDDSGAISTVNGLIEKDLVLDIAFRVGEKLEQAGCEVAYTRTNDTFITLSGRSRLASKWKADLFVSLHANTAGSTAARGRETFSMPVTGSLSTSSDKRIATTYRAGNKHDVKNGLLAFAIHERTPGRIGRFDRGVRHARFQVLRDAPCPAVLLESGFLSNPTDARNLASNWYRERYAQGVADGILAFIGYRPQPF